MNVIRSRVLSLPNQQFLVAARREEMEVDLGIRSRAQIWGAEPLYFLNTIKSSAGTGGG